jgi:putative endonuclease
MAYTYMLLCADRTLYVGSTTDLERRLTEHRVGLGSEYTRHRLPVVLVWYEQYDNVDHAFLREKQIQNWSRAKRLALVRGKVGDLPRLANTSQTPHPLAASSEEGHLDKLDDPVVEPVETTPPEEIRYTGNFEIPDPTGQYEGMTGHGC